jgi:antitoxin component of MazEF toxin-antitoxin module
MRGFFMIKKFSKHGNSLAVLIDKPILELLNIDENTSIKIKTDGINIIIEPVRELVVKTRISDDMRLQKLYEDLIEKYDQVLRKLSKN